MRILYQQSFDNVVVSLGYVCLILCVCIPIYKYDNAYLCGPDSNKCDNIESKSDFPSQWMRCCILLEINTLKVLKKDKLDSLNGIRIGITADNALLGVINTHFYKSLKAIIASTFFFLRTKHKVNWKNQSQAIRPLSRTNKGPGSNKIQINFKLHNFPCLWGVLARSYLTGERIKKLRRGWCWYRSNTWDT